MTTTDVNASAQASSPPVLNKLPAAYKRQAWLAVFALIGFVVAYFTLAAWFMLTAWRLSFGPAAGGHDGFWGYVVALCAAFLSVFMLKGVFFIKRGQPEGLVELTPAQQPRLFAFLHELADKAKAPRPHKVFVSAGVNAAVFYDLSLLNLLLPSRKNLEIGLGLVNVLSLGELRAVLAHEFGHFAQRSMAVGRWVYVAHQIAANLVARRDKLDELLNALSRFDLRVAWVGWVMRLVLWSIRSLVDSAFQWVIVMQRALSREMEMQADLVAVSLTGSDALVHALLKLQAADECWDRALGFADRDKPPTDLFAIQAHVMKRMADILDDPLYGRAPPLPAEDVAEHRVFKAELAQPPRMWLTHPLNHEREANAKRQYVPAQIDDRSAWELFEAPQALREQITRQVMGNTEVPAIPLEASVQEVDEQFDRASVHRRYRGVYLGRSVVRGARHVAGLYADENTSPEDLDRLYPDTIVHDLELLRQLERELTQLRAVQSGTLDASGGVIRYRGRELRRRDLPGQITKVQDELRAARQQLDVHDRLCRSAHLAAARQAGQGWDEHVQGLVAVLHYADHTEANLRDLQKSVGHTFRVLTATGGNLGDAKLTRLIDACNKLQEALVTVFGKRRQLALDPVLCAALKIESWTDFLGDLDLPRADKGNISAWIGVVDSWVNKATSCCAALRRVALDELLAAEHLVARHLQDGAPLEPAPPPSVVPTDYDLLLVGQEREPDEKLDWWARFLTADGKLAAVGRLTVAGAIVAGVLSMGGSLGKQTITVYNGLARTVQVRIAQDQVTLKPFESTRIEVDAGQALHVEAHTAEGRLIEAFDTEGPSAGARPVYNVAGASPLMVWTATYGSEKPPANQMLGAARWQQTSADFLFTEPPRSINIKAGARSTRDVLEGMGQVPISRQLEALEKYPADRDRVIAMHAKWDAADSPDLVTWLALDAEKAKPGQALADRLADSPQDVLLLRLQQDLSQGEQARGQVCAKHRAQAQSHPDSPDWAYMATRCLPDGAGKSDAFLQGAKQWPSHAWFNYAASYVDAEQARWREALAKMELARQKLPAVAESIVDDEARIVRHSGIQSPNLAQLQAASSKLKFQLILENPSARGEDLDPLARAYVDMAEGRFTQGQNTLPSEADVAARWLRLAAASDDAPPEFLKQVHAISLESGLDDVTFWSATGLAMRLNEDLGPYQSWLREHARPRQEEQLRMWRALMSVRQRGAEGLREQDLQGLMPRDRGLVYSAAATALGKQAPAVWRDAARHLLFISERPHFN